MSKKPVAKQAAKQAAKKLLPQPSEPASIAPTVEHHEREIAEAKATRRLGPGRIHHCMRTIDVAEEALAPMVKPKKSADQQIADYPTRGTIDDPNRSGASSILRAVEKGGAITRETLTELLELLRTKTDYHFHVEVAVLPSKSALLKTIDNERDAKETIRRLRTKAPVEGKGQEP